MKSSSKTAYFLLLVASGNTSFGMMRTLLRKPIPSRQYQQLSPKRFMHTKASSIKPQPPLSLSTRIQQAIRNTWARLTGRASQAPVIATSQEIALHPLAESLTTPVQTPSIATSSPIPTLQHIDHIESGEYTEIAQEIVPVLKAIELSKEKNLPEKKETALMVCTPPGIEIDYISSLQSFDAIINFIKTLKIKILTDAGLNSEEINDILLQLDSDQKYIYEKIYTTPSAPVLHDTTLDPNILQEIIIKLKQAGINPLCVNILNKPKEEMKDGFAIADGPLMIEELLLIPPTLIFSQELINKRSREDIGFLISHEIGHLILCHYNATYFLEKRISRILMKKNDLDAEQTKEDEDPLLIKLEKTLVLLRVKRVLREIRTLFELEADITYSLYDKNIAESSLRSVQARINRGRSDTATMRSDVHQSTNMQYHWLKRIHDLHKAQETAKE